MPQNFIGETTFQSTIRVDSFIALGVLFYSALAGAYSLKANPKNPINRLFFLLMSSITVYQFAQLETIFPGKIEDVDFWQRLSYLLSLLVATNFLVFTFFFPQQNKKFDNKFFAVFYLPFFLFLNFLFNNFLISTVFYYSPNSKIVRYGFAFPFFYVFVLSIFSVGAVNLLVSFRKADKPIIKVQSAYALIGVIFGGVLGLFGDDILNLLSLQSESLTSMALGIFSLFITYAILRQKPLAIEVIIRKSLIYYILTALLISFYVLIVKNLGAFLGHLIGYNSIFVESILIAAFAFIFKPLTDVVDNWITLKIFPNLLEHKKLQNEIDELILDEIDIHKICELIAEKYHSILEIFQVAIWVLNNKEEKLDLIYCSKDNNAFNEVNDIYLKSSGVKKLKEIIIKDKKNFFVSNKISEISEEPFYNNFALFFPVIIKNKLISLIGLGEKKDGTSFSEDEIEFIGTINKHLAVIIENVLMFHEMQQVQKEIMQKEKLAVIGEFSAGLAHEFRNPLSNIKGSAEIIQKTITENSNLKKFTGYILEETERLNKLVTQFLEFARPWELTKSKINLNSLIDKIIDLLNLEIERKSINVIKKYKHNLFIDGDEEKLKQVFNNLLVNAVQSFTSDENLKQIIVETNLSGDKSGKIIISDNGEGIENEDLKNIFNPFFTTKEQGIGLGLTVVQQIIEKHKGSIEVKSQLNKGTTFEIILPVLPQQDKETR